LITSGERSRRAVARPSHRNATRASTPCATPKEAKDILVLEDPRLALAATFLFVCGVTALLALILSPFYRRP
jgi:hypothetical protein